MHERSTPMHPFLFSAQPRTLLVAKEVREAPPVSGVIHYSGRAWRRKYGGSVKSPNPGIAQKYVQSPCPHLVPHGGSRLCRFEEEKHGLFTRKTREGICQEFRDVALAAKWPFVHPPPRASIRSLAHPPICLHSRPPTRIVSAPFFLPLLTRPERDQPPKLRPKRDPPSPSPFAS